MIHMIENRAYWIICVALVPFVLFFCFAQPWTVTADHWETAAAIRAISQDIVHPANPMLALPGYTSPRFTPYTVFWGAVMRWIGLNLFAIIGFAGVANYLLFVTGLARFVRRQFRDQILPAYVLLTMLMIWGTGYSEAGAYQLGVFLQTLPLIAIFAYGMSFHALASLRAYIDESKWLSLVAYLLCMTIAFVSHPITGAFGFIAAAAMLLAESGFRKMVLLQIVPLFSVGIAVLWPYFDYVHVLTKGTTEVWYKNPIFSNQIEALGPALAGIPIIFYYAMKRQYLFLASGFIFCAIIYGICKAMDIQIGSRFILYGAIFLHLAIAHYIQEQKLIKWSNLRTSVESHGLAFVLIVLMLLPALWYRAREMKWTMEGTLGSFSHLHAYQSPAQRFFFLSDYLNTSDVVLAEDSTGWVIPAITGAKLVAQLKGNPLINEDVKRRREEANGFFDNAMSLENRREILQKYHVTQILLDRTQRSKWDKSFLQDLSVLGENKVEQKMIALYRIRNQ
jgi:hypothetical protein